MASSYYPELKARGPRYLDEKGSAHGIPYTPRRLARRSATPTARLCAMPLPVPCLPQVRVDLLGREDLVTVGTQDVGRGKDIDVRTCREGNEKDTKSKLAQRHHLN
jgi:hypothetical protein